MTITAHREMDPIQKSFRVIAFTFNQRVQPSGNDNWFDRRQTSMLLHCCQSVKNIMNGVD